MDNPNSYNPLLITKIMASLVQKTFCLKDIPLSMFKKLEVDVSPVIFL